MGLPDPRRTPSMRSGGGTSGRVPRRCRSPCYGAAVRLAASAAPGHGYAAAETVALLLAVPAARAGRPAAPGGHVLRPAGLVAPIPPGPPLAPSPPTLPSAPPPPTPARPPPPL